MDGAWYSFPEYCRNTFGKRLYRAALDCGMTCPNRDGTLGTRGCIFCGEGGSGDFAVHYEGGELSRAALLFNHQDAAEGQYIAYFQSYTNTYAPAERLRRIFAGALSNPLFAGISIATRPDCVGEDVIALLAELKKEYPDKFIWIELGLQSMHEKTAVMIRRGYPLAVFDDCVRRLHEINIPVIVHVILGLPDETPEMVHETILHLNQVKIAGIKIQLLHYLTGTDLGELYQNNPERFHVLTMEEYADLAAECVGLLDPSVVVHRITGDGNKENLLAPMWSTDKRRVINTIRHVCKQRGIVQGSLRSEYE